jgi:hypothetical protein
MIIIYLLLNLGCFSPVKKFKMQKKLVGQKSVLTHPKNTKHNFCDLAIHENLNTPILLIGFSC